LLEAIPENGPAKISSINRGMSAQKLAAQTIVHADVVQNVIVEQSPYNK